jgi:hypothetical protein
VLCLCYRKIHVIWSLTQNETINFLHANKNLCADWWDLPLIDWDTYSETGNSTKTIFENTCTTSCKVTHLCTTCLQMAGFEGLHPHQINTLTKHILEKMYSAYQSICEKEVSQQERKNKTSKRITTNFCCVHGHRLVRLWPAFQRMMHLLFHVQS